MNQFECLPVGPPRTSACLAAEAPDLPVVEALPELVVRTALLPGPGGFLVVVLPLVIEVGLAG